MSNKLQSVVIQAIKTFNSIKLKPNSKLDDANFMALTGLVNNLLFVDINLPARLFSRSDGILRSKSPIEYLALYEDSNVVVGVFIIKKGAKIPLHDHPGMHGLLKVLHGELEIRSYNIRNTHMEESKRTSSLYFSNAIEVTKNSTKRIKTEDGCSILTPTVNNIHEVKCVEGPAAFLDILAPPYCDDFDDAAPRSCHYFKEDDSTEGCVRLIQIPCPSDYWTHQDI